MIDQIIDPHLWVTRDDQPLPSTTSKVVLLTPVSLALLSGRGDVGPRPTAGLIHGPAPLFRQTRAAQQQWRLYDLSFFSPLQMRLFL